MTKPGPQPTPTHLKIVRGNRKDRINFNEPKPKKAKPICPEWLSEQAKQIWERTASQLEMMNLLYEADQDILAAYSNAVATYILASKMVDETGILVEGRRDGMVTNPAVRIQRDSATLIKQLAGELGLTPSARTRLKAEENDDQENDILD